MALSAVIWRNKFWSDKGVKYGYAGGHMNHAHFEFPGTPGVMVSSNSQSYQDCVRLGKWLQSRGFRVGEHPAFGIVHHVHEGHGHYDHRAIDVNFGPSGENSIEKAAFDKLVPAVIREGLTVDQVIGGHPASTNSGGFLMALSDVEQEELLRKTRELHGWVGSNNPKDPGVAIRSKFAVEIGSRVETAMKRVEDALTRMDPKDPGAVHRVKAIQEKIAAIAKKLGA